MRFVVVVVFSFLSFSNAQTLDLCQVRKAEKPLLTIKQDYLLKTLYGPFVEASGHSQKKLIPTNIHPFIYAAHKAFAEHRPLTLSPDNIWLLISQGVISHLSQNSEAFKDYSSHLKSHKKLILKNSGFNSENEDEWQRVIENFSQELSTKGSRKLKPFYSPSFSTTDLNIQNAFKIQQLSARSEQFEFGLFSLCGIPEIVLEGKTDDWKKISEKLKRLEDLGMAQWADHLKPIIKEFAEASEGNVNKKFWNSFYKFNNECGDASISGWILNFFPYNSKGERRHLVQASSEDILQHIPDSDPNMSFPSGRSYLPFTWQKQNQSIKMRFEAGFMGVSQDPHTLALKAEINWAVIKRPVSGQISVWQQNVVREDAVSKKKLSAAFSATYIDVGNFIDEQDSGLENLKLLEYAIVKRPVKGAFLKHLVSLPNFKALELHDWNIDKKFLPFISQLKNKNFIFNKTVYPEFFKHLPKTAKTLIFKDIKINAQYFDHLSKSSVNRIEFNNCTFDEEVFIKLSQLNSSLKTLTINKSEELTSENLNSINKLTELKSLSITSCKLKQIPKLNLSKLSFLNLSSNKLSSIQNLNSLSNLEYLNLANNEISGSNNFDHFTKLEQLILHHNQLTALSIDLKDLSILDASNNKLQTLPEIHQNRLIKLRVEKNEINSAVFPDSLSETLEHLSLERVHLNKRNAISLGSMKKLKYLSLKNCDLTNGHINELGKLDSLNTLRIWTNREINDQCKDQIISLFKKGTNISIFDCGFSSSAMDEFARLRESLKIN